MLHASESDAVVFLDHVARETLVNASTARIKWLAGHCPSTLKVDEPDFEVAGANSSFGQVLEF